MSRPSSIISATCSSVHGCTRKCVRPSGVSTSIHSACAGTPLRANPIETASTPTVVRLAFSLGDVSGWPSQRKSCSMPACHDRFSSVTYWCTPSCVVRPMPQCAEACPLRSGFLPPRTRLQVSKSKVAGQCHVTPTGPVGDGHPGLTACPGSSGNSQSPLVSTVASAHGESWIGVLVSILQLHGELAAIVQHGKLGGIQQQPEPRRRFKRRLAPAAIHLEARFPGEPGSFDVDCILRPTVDRGDALHAPQRRLVGLGRERIRPRLGLGEETLGDPFQLFDGDLAEEANQQGHGGEGEGARIADARIRREEAAAEDRKSTRLNSSHDQNSYAVFCLKKKNKGKRGLETYGLISNLTNDFLPISS